MRKNKKDKFGFSLVEIIIAVAIFGLFATALIGLLMSAYGSNFQAEERDAAVLYAEEGMEAVWSIRRQAWNLLVNGDHGLDSPSGYWEFFETSELIADKYTRVITIEDACRNALGDLADCPADYIDLNTKKVTITLTYTAITFVINQFELVNYITTWQSRDFNQTDWAGGAGQSTWSDDTRYDTDDSNIDTSISGQVSLATSGGAGCGTKIWSFDTPGNYTYNLAEIQVVGGAAELIGGASSCTGTENACSSFGVQSPCDAQSGCSWTSGSDSCSNIGSCSAEPRQTCEASCGGASCTRSGPNCTGTLDCPAFSDQTSCEICGQCAWSGGGSCSGTATACSTLGTQSPCEAQAGCSWGGGSFPSNNSDIQPNNTYNADSPDSWTGFVEDATKNGGEIFYKLYDGTSWYWYDSGWQTTGETTSDEWNTAVDINTNISSFDASSGEIMFIAFLDSDGTQQIQLKEIQVSCSKAKNWTFDDGNNYTYDDTKIVVNDPAALSVAQLVGPSTGTKVWGFDDGNNYTHNIAEISVASSEAQLVGTASSCSGTENACSTFGTQSPCEGQTGCSWLPGSGSCSNIGSCSAEPRQSCNASCGGASCARQGNSCTGTLDCPLFADQTSCEGCGQCSWSGGGSCNGTATACTTYGTQSPCEAQAGCSWGGGSFPTTNPDIQPIGIFSEPSVAEWTNFSELATKNGGEIYYKLYDGTFWYWYSSGWQTTGETTSGEWNTASDIDTNISTFDASSGEIMFIAFLSSDGTQDVRLLEITIGWSSQSGGGDSCSGTPNACSTNGTQSPCEGQGGCSWTPGSGSCSNIGSCSAEPRQTCESSCGGAACTRSGPNCTGTLDCPAFVDQTSCEGCGQCGWSGGAGSCEGTADACSAFGTQSPCEVQSGCAWGGGSGFPTGNPSIKPTSTFNGSNVGTWNSFIETATKNGGEIYYKLFDGTFWYWYSSGWQTTGETTSGEWNTATDVNTNISTLDASSGQIMFIAFLDSDGTQQIELDNVAITWTERGTCSGASPTCVVHTNQLSCEADPTGCTWTEPGGGSYVTFGTFNSSAFDSGSSSSFNIIEWVESVSSCSPSCTIQFQVRTAPDAGGSPGVWSAWYGASGSGTYFTDSTGTIISTDLNFDQWVQYRVELAGDGNTTPILTDATINYTP